ncbi:MAG: LacI family DNA-binding transcriptional regulator [Flavobacterium sp.]|nr:LacI family DNA-binding transcriptional regulator [Flavobacterium sp.]MBP8157056.1 LacI family DNA-binding transcriptional regulator [Flavobacterium sp.]
MKETTLKEIAIKLGISTTTVSKALKNYTDVSPKTKAAVLELAEKLNYSPNNFALYLKSKESKTIGLIIPEVVHHFFSNVIRGIIEASEEEGYLVIILQSNETMLLEKKQVDLLINKRVDGILISLSNESNAELHLKNIMKKEIPLVQFDKISKMIPSSKVIIDDRKAAFSAVEHLIGKGCKKIVHLRGPINPQNSVDRFLGYKSALEKNNIVYDPSLVHTCIKVDFEEGREFAKKILETQPEVDGIFAITDLVAIGVLNYFNEIDPNLTKRIKVIGFSNWNMSEVITPSLSTVHQPGYEMGIASFKVLLEEIKAKKLGEKFPPKTIVLDTYVVERNSTK